MSAIPQNEDWVPKYRTYNTHLIEYGWFVAPFILNQDFSKLESVVNTIAQHPSPTQDQRVQLEKYIFLTLLTPVFHPNFRARFVWVGLQLDHFKEFSHLYETGIIAYYKREYIAAITCMLPALEGVLLSSAGWKLRDKRISHGKLVDVLRAATQKVSLYRQEEHDLFRDTLADFLDRWIYQHTSQADFSLSVLNRHYVLHGFEASNFYRPEDVHRLILLFDLLIEFLISNQGLVVTGFVPNPGTYPLFDKRREYYDAVASNNRTLKQCWDTERALLADHPRYIAPTQEADMNVQILLSLADEMNLWAKIEEIKRTAQQHQSPDQ